MRTGHADALAARRRRTGRRSRWTARRTDKVAALKRLAKVEAAAPGAAGTA